MRIQNIYWENIAIDEGDRKLTRTNCMIRVDEYTISIQDRDRDGHLIYADPRITLLTAHKLLVEAEKILWDESGLPHRKKILIEANL